MHAIAKVRLQPHKCMQRHRRSRQLSMYAGLQWNLILYADGITPGDAFSPDNNRKAWVWYASFLEMGQKLSSEEVWITVAIARTRLPALLCELAVTTALPANTRRLQPQAMRCRVRAPHPNAITPSRAQDKVHCEALWRCFKAHARPASWHVLGQQWPGRFWSGASNWSKWCNSGGTYTPPRHIG